MKANAKPDEKQAPILTRGQAGHILRKAKQITALADELGVHRITVSMVLRGKTTSARIMAAAIARAAEVKAEGAA